MNASLTVRTVRLASSTSWLLRRQPAEVHTSVPPAQVVTPDSAAAPLPLLGRAERACGSACHRPLWAPRAGVSWLAVVRVAAPINEFGVGSCPQFVTVRRHDRCRAVVIGSGGEQLIADLARLPETGRSVYWIQEQAQVHLRLLWLLKYFENVQR
jgi:hypothetical protein